MGNKKKKGETSKKIKRDVAKIDERVKSINAIRIPDETPFKKDNENRIDRWRPLWRTDRLSIAEKKRKEKRHNRPKRPQGKRF